MDELMERIKQRREKYRQKNIQENGITYVENCDAWEECKEQLCNFLNNDNKFMFFLRTLLFKKNAQEMKNITRRLIDIDMSYHYDFERNNPKIMQFIAYMEYMMYKYINDGRIELKCITLMTSIYPEWDYPDDKNEWKTPSRYLKFNEYNEAQKLFITIFRNIQKQFTEEGRSHRFYHSALFEREFHNIRYVTKEELEQEYQNETHYNEID